MRILVIDDHPVFLKGIEYLLGTQEPQPMVHTALGVTDALEILDRSSIDVILLDLNLPSMDGLAFLDALKLRDQRPPVLLMSAEVDGKRILAALHAGAAGFVPKSATPQELA